MADLANKLLGFSSHFSSPAWNFNHKGNYARFPKSKSCRKHFSSGVPSEVTLVNSKVLSSSKNKRFFHSCFVAQVSDFFPGLCSRIPPTKRVFDEVTTACLWKCVCFFRRVTQPERLLLYDRFSFLPSAVRRESPKTEQTTSLQLPWSSVKK